MLAKNSESYERQEYWQTPSNNTITSQQALLTGANITETVFDALAATKVVFINVPNGAVSMELRFYGNVAADADDVVQLYACASVPDGDFYRHFAQLTIVMGTGYFDGTNTFHDTMTPANEAWLSAAAEISPANNTFAAYTFNLHKHNKIAVIASDLDGTLIGVQYRIV